MRLTISMTLLLFQFTSGFSQTLFDYSLKDFNGRTLNFRADNDKYILFVLMPVPVTDSFLSELVNFQKQYIDQVQVIGALGSEADSEWLNSQAGIIFTNLISYTEKPSIPFFQWLTDQKNNHSFFKNSFAPGFKFLIDGNGKIVLADPPSSPLKSPFVRLLLENKRLKN